MPYNHSKSSRKGKKDPSDKKKPGSKPKDTLNNASEINQLALSQTGEHSPTASQYSDSRAENEEDELYGKVVDSAEEELDDPAVEKQPHH
jgi:hypothetical protein